MDVPSTDPATSACITEGSITTGTQEGLQPTEAGTGQRQTTWTKRPPYGPYQSTLNLNDNMSELPVSRDNHSIEALRSETTNSEPETGPALNYNTITAPESKLIFPNKSAAEFQNVCAEQVMLEVKTQGLSRPRAEAIRVGLSEHERNLNENTSSFNENKSIARHTILDLQKTLLHEHHNFSLALQHPGIQPGLTELAIKWAMPFRTWHLETQNILTTVLHHLPENHGKITAFMNEAYVTAELWTREVPGMADDWVTIREALDSFCEVMRELLQVCANDSHDRSATMKTPQVQAAMRSAAKNKWLRLASLLNIDAQPQQSCKAEFSDVYISGNHQLGQEILERRRDAAAFIESDLPLYAVDILDSWPYMGQGITFNNFNIFCKLFALLLLTAQNLEL